MKAFPSLYVGVVDNGNSKQPDHWHNSNFDLTAVPNWSHILVRSLYYNVNNPSLSSSFASTSNGLPALFLLWILLLILIYCHHYHNLLFIIINNVLPPQLMILEALYIQYWMFEKECKDSLVSTERRTLLVIFQFAISTSE